MIETYTWTFFITYHYRFYEYLIGVIGDTFDIDNIVCSTVANQK